MNIRRPTTVALALALTLFASCRRDQSGGVARPTPPKPNYSFSEVISFGRGGRSDRYKRGGWGDTEKDLTWTNGRSARLIFVLPDSKNPLRLRMHLGGFVDPPRISAQPVEIYVNDEYMADWDVTEVDDFFAIIPPDVANHEQFIVDLRLPKATSPKMLGRGDDPRTLGVSCFNLDISETTSAEAMRGEEERERRRAEAGAGNAYNLGDVIHFGTGENARRYEVLGWYPAEDKFTWTGKGPAVLELKTNPVNKPLDLRMRLAGMVAPRSLPAQNVSVLVNGEKVANWTVSVAGEFETRIPRNVAEADNGKLKIELQIPNATSARSLGVGDDKRILGVRCEELTVDEAQAGLPPERFPSPGDSR